MKKVKPKKPYANKRIVFELEKVGARGLIVNIVYMSDELRAEVKYKRVTLFKKDGFFVFSTVVPSMSDNFLHVLGTEKEADFITPMRLFDTEKERNAMYKFLVLAEKQINKRFKKRQLTHS